MTKEQQVVVDSKLANGYEFIGNFVSHNGYEGHSIGLFKGNPRVHINVLGYDEYVNHTNYKEVK